MLDRELPLPLHSEGTDDVSEVSSSFVALSSSAVLPQILTNVLMYFRYAWCRGKDNEVVISDTCT